ncbi:MAG TPA: MarR family transcriptional regulator, partial [Chloroflexota bacterium]
ELSRRCWLSSPAITAAVDDLVEDGLLARAHSEKDRRKVLVRLTPTGELALRETRAAATATLAGLLHGWDDQRVRALAAMLRDLDRAAENRLSTTRE